MTSDNAEDGVETEARALAQWFGREEWLKDPALDTIRDARSVVDNFNVQIPVIARSTNRQLSLRGFLLLTDGIDRINEQISPDLVEFAASRTNLGDGTIVVAHDFDPAL